MISYTNFTVTQSCYSLYKLRIHYLICLFFFFFNDTATTEIYTLSLHDALPIRRASLSSRRVPWTHSIGASNSRLRSEEHTSELQSQSNLVCRLLLEKKKKNTRQKPQLCQNRYKTHVRHVENDH